MTSTNGISTDRKDTEVYLILVEKQTNDDGVSGQYIVTPVSYDLEGDPATGARALSAAETPESSEELVPMVVEELESLAMTLIGAAVQSAMPINEVFVKYLSDFKGQPVEVIHNMLAAMLTSAVDELRGDEEVGNIPAGVTPPLELVASEDENDPDQPLSGVD